MQTRQKVLSVLALAGVSAAALTMFDSACGGTSCDSVCTKIGTCTGQPMRNCPAFCAAIDAIDGPGNCTGRYDDTLNCYGGITDPCTDHSCDGTLATLLTCDTAYCLTHASDPNCATYANNGN